MDRQERVDQGGAKNANKKGNKDGKRKKNLMRRVFSRFRYKGSKIVGEGNEENVEDDVTFNDAVNKNAKKKLNGRPDENCLKSMMKRMCPCFFKTKVFPEEANNDEEPTRLESWEEDGNEVDCPSKIEALLPEEATNDEEPTRLQNWEENENEMDSPSKIETQVVGLPNIPDTSMECFFEITETELENDADGGDTEGLGDSTLAKFDGVKKSKEFAGLSDFPPLIGHAFLEMKDISLVFPERKRRLKKAFRAASAHAKKFHATTVEALKAQVACMELVVQRMENFVDRRRTIWGLQTSSRNSLSENEFVCDQKAISLDSVLSDLELFPKSKEKWMMTLGDIGSNLILYDRLDESEYDFADLEEENQVQVTTRLLEVFVQIFELVSKAVECWLEDEIQRIRNEVKQLEAGIKMIARWRLLSDERFGVPESLDKLVASIISARRVVTKIEDLSMVISFRLRSIKMFKDIKFIPPDDLTVEQVNENQELGLHIRKFHSSPVSVGLPIIF